jgi:hypothetical protein
MTEKPKLESEITLGLITSWILGTLFAIAALTELRHPGACALSLLVALLLLPPARRLVHRLTGKTLSTPARVVIALLLIPVAIIAGHKHHSEAVNSTTSLVSQALPQTAPRPDATGGGPRSADDFLRENSKQ